MDNQIGNQQESFLHWFGGIVDGEGCITISYRIQRNRFIQLSPRLVINNTNKNLIDECQKGLTELKVPFYLTVRHFQKQKTQYHLEILGIKRMAKLIPYLRVRAKKEEINLVRKFIESRLHRTKENNNVCLPYNNEEINLVVRLYEIHCRKNPQRLYAKLSQLNYAKYGEKFQRQEICHHSDGPYGFRKGMTPWNKGKRYRLKEKEDIVQPLLKNKVV